MAFVTGALHSGPLTAVRYVGAVGLVLLYGLMIVSAVYACRCVRRCKGTLLQPVTIYLAIQLIWIPINYTFIFAAYNVDMPQLVFHVALLRLVMRMEPFLPTTERKLTTSVPSARPSLSQSKFGT
jgi:hypothetical protein